MSTAASSDINNNMTALRRLQSLTRPFRLLAIESSADDSCASIVSSDRRILSNVVVKQHLIHGLSLFAEALIEGINSKVSFDREIRRDTSDQEPGCSCEEYCASS